MKNRLLNDILTDKRFKIKSGYPDFNIGTIAVIWVCVMLLTAATFTKFNLFVFNFFSPYDAYRGENSTFVSFFTYIPQVPAVCLIAALLGPIGGMLAVFLYILAGLLGFPVFSSGGGFEYFTKPAMGYLLGFFPAVFFISNIMKQKNIKFRLIKASLAGIICVHLAGVIYLTILMFCQGAQFFLILSWIWLLTGMQLLYDFLFGMLAILIGRAGRKVFSIITD